MLRNLDGRYPHMPGDMVDRNRNGAVDPDEIDIPTKAAPGICGMGPGFFASIDRDKNGLVPPAELQADIRRPTSSIRSGCGSRSAAGPSS